jgi:hypothetical protein
MIISVFCSRNHLNSPGCAVLYVQGPQSWKPPAGRDSVAHKIWWGYHPAVWHGEGNLQRDASKPVGTAIPCTSHQIDGVYFQPYNYTAVIASIVCCAGNRHRQ